MRVLVTGGSGFLGRRVLPRLGAAGHEAVALARSAEAARTVAAHGTTVVRGDLDDPASTDHAFRASRADALLNLASLGFGHAPVIVAAAADAGIRRAVFVSTTAIFTGLDASSRAVRVAAEETVTGSELDWTIVRPTMIYGGPDDRNMARLLALLRRSPVVPVPGGGTRLQQPVHVEDLADAIVACLSAPASVRRAYDVAGPAPLSFRDVIRAAGDAVGRTPRIVPIPMTAAVLAARGYERISSRPRVKAEQLERLAEDKAFDIGAARRDLAFEPRSFEDGIREQASAR